MADTRNRNKAIPQHAPESDVTVDNNFLTVVGVMGLPISNADSPVPGALLLVDPNGVQVSQITQLPDSFINTRTVGDSILQLLVADVSGNLVFNRSNQIVTEI